MQRKDYEKLITSKGFTRRDFGKLMGSLGLSTAVLGPFAGRANAATGLTVFTQSLYAVPEVYPDYPQAANLQFSIFAEQNESLEKIKAGYQPDIVGPTSHVVPRFGRDKLVRPIDTARVEAWGDIYPALKDDPDLIKDGSHIALPWAWSVVSAMYRTDLAAKYVGNESWNILWDAEYKGRLAQRDSAEVASIQALLTLGFKDPYANISANLDKIKERLKEQRALVRFYWQSETEAANALVGGEIVAAYAWASTYRLAKNAGAPVAFMNPKEGGIATTDVLMINAGSTADEAEVYAFINACLGTKTAAYLMETFGIASASKTAFDQIDPALAAEYGFSDPNAMLKSAVRLKAMTDDERKAVVSIFEEVKAGL